MALPRSIPLGPSVFINLTEQIIFNDKNKYYYKFRGLRSSRFSRQTIAYFTTKHCDFYNDKNSKND